ncbi:hypothetical protein ACFQV2_04105 [Actinokineospora soli]|uniref:Uncharacterized protein n=1 Tax=Actinokineospora soli TaxID=1048753 RepID=A0ABW2THN4_9PSEU
MSAEAAPLVEYSVLLRDGADPAAVVAAVEGAGGKVVSANAAAGLVTASAPETAKSTLDQTPGVEAVARSRPIGRSPRAVELRVVEREHHADRAGSKPRPGPTGMDPLDVKLWGSPPCARTSRGPSSRGTSASGSVCSTPASTGATPTSRPTSTRRGRATSPATSPSTTTA